MFITGHVHAQALTTNITGTVMAEKGELLAGVTVRALRTGARESAQSVTDEKGVFVFRQLSVGATYDFTFSSVGYQTAYLNGFKVSPDRNSSILMTLKQVDSLMGDVVVTALGITTKRKAIGYSIQEVKGSALTEARETNFVNSLEGRVAGLNVVGGSNGIGGSARVVIRGETSLAGDNQPLFVVDGIPISNAVSASSQDQNIDYGNGAADLNADDIESVSVLKGPNAAALYGSRAANGVILITTKKGKASFNVSVNSTSTFESVLRLPQFQNMYGQGRGGVYNIGDGGRSWGPLMDGHLVSVPVRTEWPPKIGEKIPWSPQPNNVKDFYQTGTTFTNNVAISGGNDKGHFRASYTNLAQTGLVPNTDQKRDNIVLTTDYKLTDKLTFNAAINYIDINSKNRPVVSYGNESVVYTWIWEGRQVPTNKVRNYWVKGLEGLQDFDYNYTLNDNPYYTVHENLNGYQKARWIASGSLNYKFNDNLDLMVRTGLDQSNERRDSRRTPGSNAFPQGMYRQDRNFFQERNTDFLLSWHKQLSSDFTVKVSGGGNQMEQKEEDLTGIAGQLSVPGIYNLGNSSIPLVNDQFDSKYQINSFYGYGQATYKNAIFLDVTGRNDWSSSLPVVHDSYFYPSVSLSTVFTDLLHIPATSPLSFGKLRASWAQVGNDTRPYRLRNVYSYESPWNTSQAVSDPSSIANAGLLPEKLNTYEAGTELRFFNNRIGLDFTYYNTVSRNQILSVPIDQTSGYTTRYLNAGEIRSHGFEVMLNLTPIKLANSFRWDINVNWSANRAKVVKLIDGLDTYELPSRYVAVEAKVGGRMGDMYAPDFQRDPQGNIVYSNGVPNLSNTLKKIGNYNPDWISGVTNVFTYKGFLFSTLFDYKHGGSIYSYLYQRGNVAGELVQSLQGRRTGESGVVGKGVVQNNDGTYSPNTVKVGAETFWESNYLNPQTATFKATYLKLREVKFGWTVPQKLTGRKFPLKDLTIMLVGRNLRLWTKVPHIDPDTSGLAGSTILPGIEDMTLPSSKSMGLNINFKF
jgi:TonB-linked SusC/RagA family outer membrane protein